MLYRRLPLVILLCVLALLPRLSGMAGAAERLPATGRLDEGESAAVVEVIDGDTVMLSSGLEVRLVGLQAPKLPLGRPGFVAWPLAEEAKAALESTVAGRRVSLRYGGSRRDRYGRALAHLVRDDGLWVQGTMLRQGHARVYSFPDNRALVVEMLALERQARTERAGIWALPYYRVRNPDETRQDIDSFQIVEGRVVAAAAVKGTVFLNFGADWRTDFTFEVPGRATRLFREAGVDLLSLDGKRVRGRGWVKPVNGPLIELTHPEQLELIGE